ncbi:DUF397 domain-containing protein [Streptomyces boncukensis]|uniref:DUF397 domain-containing protein n=1 Tax=Streptomyces boncukensis TaxID=2711219 RepID=A0A6G4WSY4_9ACTN|nr:DUF397 domain-containing protein [Streptomyces boncukensis]NGO68218.1 DUF397 domain-containing protein [Streptomyces boncukensis]
MSEMADLYAVDLADVVWRKSSYTAGNGNCVEVADTPGAAGVAVRDSKNVDIPAARVSRRAWCAFLASVAEDTLSA